MIVGQDFGNCQRPHGQHRSAIGQAVTLVEPRLIVRQSGIEIGACLWEHGHQRIAARPDTIRPEASPRRWHRLMGSNERTRGSV
jgi:hypothetical protein